MTPRTGTDVTEHAEVRGWSSRRGTTVVEALVTLALLGLVLSITGSVVREVNRIDAHSHLQDQRQRFVLTTLDVLRKDAREAISVDLPATIGTASSKLRLTSLGRQHQANRLDNSVPGNFFLRRPEWLRTVEFEATDGRLLRSVEEDGTTASSVIGAEVRDFSAELVTGSQLRFRFTLGDETNQKTFSGLVCLIVDH